MEAIIIVPLIGGLSLPPGGVQCVLTASTTRIDDLEVLLFAFNLRRQTSFCWSWHDLSFVVFCLRWIQWWRWSQDLYHVVRCEEEDHLDRRDDIVFMPSYASLGWPMLMFCRSKYPGFIVVWHIYDLRIETEEYPFVDDSAKANVDDDMSERGGGSRMTSWTTISVGACLNPLGRPVRLQMPLCVGVRLGVLTTSACHLWAGPRTDQWMMNGPCRPWRNQDEDLRRLDVHLKAYLNDWHAYL